MDEGSIGVSPPLSLDALEKDAKTTIRGHRIGKPRALVVDPDFALALVAVVRAAQDVAHDVDITGVGTSVKHKSALAAALAPFKEDARAES